MIRKFLLAAAVIALGACQPAAEKAAPAAPATPAATPAPATTANDWHFVAHGGSGDLDFGDGDWAEGESLFHMSCLPNSRSVEMSWRDPDGGSISSGGQTAAFGADASAPTDHPVLAALRASGSAEVEQGGAKASLAGSAAGKAEVEKFFAYCTKPAA